MSKSFLRTRALRWGVVLLALATLMALAVGNWSQAGAVSNGAAALPPPAIHTIPSADGTAIFMKGERLQGFSTPLYANFGPTSYERSHTGQMDGDNETGIYFYTFVDADTSRTPWVSVTTTWGTTETVTLGKSDLAFHYVSGEDFRAYPSRDNNLQLDVPAGALSDTYIIIMDTVAPPGDPPPGHRLLNKAYSIRASGAITQSQAPMALYLSYEQSALGDTDTHTFSILFWDQHLREWQDTESEPFGDQPRHVKTIRRFGTYGLMAGTTWSDPFQDYSGLAERQNVRLAYGGRLALRSGYDEGFAVSVPITPTGAFAGWGQLHYTAEITAGTALTVDVLAADGTLLLASLPNGASLASIDPAAHPSLRLRANLSTQQAGVTPYLDSWAINWTPEAPPSPQRIYLPLLTAGAGETGRQGEGGRTTGSPARVLPVSLSPHHPVSWFGCDPPPEPPITWSPPVPLTQGTETAIAPDLAVDGDNRLHAVWYNGSRTVLYASKEPGDTTWTAPISISNSGAAYYPDVAVDPEGNVHVIWEENDDIFYATKPSAGDWSSPVKLSNTGQANIMPGLYADADGNLHAVWSDGSPGNDEILYAFKGSGAGAWSATERVSDTAGKSWVPDVVADSQGDVHVAWHDFTLGPTEIYYAMKPADGSWSQAEQVSYTIGASISPALAVDSAGTVHVVWQDSITTSSPPPPFKILYASKPVGGDWSPFFLQLSDDTANAGTPALASGPDEGLHVAWDTTDTYALLYTHRPAPDMGWTAPMTVTAISPGTQYPFPALAASPDETVHLLWSDLGLTAIFHSSAAPPPIPEEHVLVLDESGRAVSGACVYRNGQLAGTTNDVGIFVPEGLAVGDRLVALKPLAERSAAPGSPWAYRTALTSLEIDAVGNVSGYTVTVPGRQRLTLPSDTPLVYFNLVVSIQWNATPEYMQEIAAAVRLASDYLYDVSDGQMAFGHVAIYDDSVRWEEADIQILTRNNVRPYAYIGGITSPDPSQVIRMGRHWDGRSGAQGPWNEHNGFRTLIHEFGHYALYLYDSYFEYLYDAHGHLIGVNTATGCTELDFDPAYDAVNATIMDYQYETSELAAQGVPGLWEPDTCELTVQWHENGESDWETLLSHYGDSAEPPRWQFASPLTRREVLAGPERLPADLLPFPKVEVHEQSPAAPPRQLTVLGPDSRPYPLGALVALDTQCDGRTVTLDQGLTDDYGRIAIYGAADGDTLRTTSIDGGLWAQTTVSTATAYTMTLRGLGGLHAASAPVNPYASLIPYSEGRDLTLAVGGVGVGGALSALVMSPVADSGRTISLSYSPTAGDYQGTASFPAGTTGLGSVHVRGLGGLGQRVTVDSDFHLARIDVAAGQDLYTPDGGAWLHLDPHSFPMSNVCMALMPTGAVPQPLPSGMTAVGNAYSIRASGGHMILERPGVLRLFYEREDLGPGVGADALHIARWDGSVWQLFPSQPDPERHAVSARTSQLGIYALLAAEGPLERAFLPVVAR